MNTKCSFPFHDGFIYTYTYIQVVLHTIIVAVTNQCLVYVLLTIMITFEYVFTCMYVNTNSCGSDSQNIELLIACKCVHAHTLVITHHT